MVGALPDKVGDLLEKAGIMLDWVGIPVLRGGFRRDRVTSLILKLPLGLASGQAVDGFL